MSCIVGHKQHAFECPGCAEGNNGRPQELDAWRWYRTRTSSKRIRAAVDAVIRERASTDSREDGKHADPR